MEGLASQTRRANGGGHLFALSVVSGQSVVCRLGNHLKMAKTDQERMGLFSEMGYATIGDPYKSGNVESERIPVCSAVALPGELARACLQGTHESPSTFVHGVSVRVKDSIAVLCV